MAVLLHELVDVGGRGLTLHDAPGDSRCTLGRRGAVCYASRTGAGTFDRRRGRPVPPLFPRRYHL